MANLKIARLLTAVALPLLMSVASHATTIAELAAGPPKAVESLGESTFVPFDVVALKDARVAYMDYEWFRSRGVEIPPEGLRSPELNKQMLEAFGWMTPGRDDLDHSFDKSRTRKMYAYYYGGDGLGGNVGSGRSAAISHFDLKGLATPLIKSKDTYHSNGAAVTIEAIDEAIWSRVLEAETRFGANHVVAVIFTGTYVKTPGAEDRWAPRALIVREMGLRPAHFMINYDREKIADQKRVAEALKSILKELPYPAGFKAKNDREAVREGVLELTRREAIVQAEMFAKRLYFGSNSPSNLEITGRRLDLGDHTAQEGYTKIIRIDDESPFGETDEFKRIQELVRDSLSKTLPKDLAAALPTKEELAREFDRTWAVRQKVEMIKLAGIPDVLTERLVRSPESLAFGSAILDVALAGNTQRVFFNPAVSPNTSTYNLGRVLTALVRAAPSERSSAVSSEIKDAALRAKLVSTFEAYLPVVEAAAAKDGVSSAALKTYARNAVVIRNRTRSTLFRGDARWKHLWNITDQALHGKDGMITQNYVEEEIARNRQNFKDAKPFELVMENRENAAQGWSLRKIFDAKTNRASTKLVIDVSLGKGYFGGRYLSASELEKSVLESSKGAVTASRNGKFVEFTLEGVSEMDASKLRVSTLEEIKAKREAAAREQTSKARGAIGVCRELFRAG